MVLTDQPTAPCLDGSELAAAQQVVDEFPGDAQQFGSLLRAVGEPFGERVTIEDFARLMASSSSRTSLASSRVSALVLSSARSAALGAVTSLSRLVLPGDDGCALRNRSSDGRRRTARRACKAAVHFKFGATVLTNALAGLTAATGTAVCRS